MCIVHWSANFRRYDTCSTWAYMFYPGVHAPQGVDIVGLPVILEAASGRLMPGCWLAGGCLLTGSWLLADG
jgi:hypothetical protein